MLFFLGAYTQGRKFAITNALPLFHDPSKGSNKPRRARLQEGKPAGEGQPEAEEAVGCIMWAMRLLGYGEERKALQLALDSYMRTQELCDLEVRDIIFQNDDGKDEVAIFLRETKTGANQGVRVDWPGTASMLRDQVKSKQRSQKVFNITAQT